MSIIGKITTFIVAASMSCLWNGYALSILWKWFMVPGLGLPPLSLGYSIGVALVVGYLTSHAKQADADQSWTFIFVFALIKPAVALLTGWIVTLFM